MRSHAEKHARRNAAMSPITVRVDRNGRGGWEVAMSDQHEPVTCETLDDARRVAYLCAAHPRPCELIVCDAYHRVLHHELINGRGGLGPPARTPAPGDISDVRRQQAVLSDHDECLALLGKFGATRDSPASRFGELRMNAYHRHRYVGFSGVCPSSVATTWRGRRAHSRAMNLGRPVGTEPDW
jgi:hypothetical protein